MRHNVLTQFLSLCFISLLFLFSCKSTEHNLFPETEEPTVPSPALMTELPTVIYKGAGIKYEFESMLLNQFIVFPDTEASGQYAVQMLNESSSAKLKVFFQPGTYECLISEKAYDNEHAPFYLYLDKIPYRIYPSDPPLGSWELTTRVPVYFTIEEPRTILFTIQANSEKKLGSYGMNLDYIQFVKRY